MEEETTVNQRVRLLVDKLTKGNVAAFAASLGRKGGVIGDIVGGKLNKPSFGILSEILLTYPRISPDWLIHGTGEMDRPDRAHPSVATDDQPAYGRASDIQLVTVDNAGKENIALVETRAQAGYARGGLLEREYLRDLPTFTLPGSRYRNGTFRAFQVAGDSMEPDLFSGDIVIARRLQSWPNEIKNGAVHVVVTLDDVLVKRVLNQLDAAGSLALESDNTAYPVRAIEGHEVREVWLAIARISAHFPSPTGDQDLARKIDATNTEVAALRLRLERFLSPQPSPKS